MVNRKQGQDVEQEDELAKPFICEESSCAAIRQLAAWRVLAVLCGVAFTSNVIISLIAPILPVHYEYIDMPQIWCGLMFSCFPMAMLLFSPSAVQAMALYGRVPVLFVGLVLQGVTSITFGYADELTGGAGVNKGWAIAVYTLSRLACGAGGACANNAIFSIAADRFPDTLSKVMGLNEVVIGAGFALGPPIGNVLFLKYGFNICFLASGIVMLVFAPMSLVLWQPHSRGKSALDDVADDSSRKSMREVLTPGLLVGGITLLLGTGVFGVVEPILGLYLQHEVGVAPASIGAIFAVFAFAYALAGPLAGALADSVGALRTCSWGSLGAGLVLLCLLGPTARFLDEGTSERVGYEVVVLVVLGVFQAATLIPSLPAMKDSVVGSSSSVTERVVAWFNMFMQLGLVIGPLIGTAMRDALGFEVAVAVYGAGVAAWGAFALAFSCRRRRSTSVADASPAHLVTGVTVSPMSQRQRFNLPDEVVRQISF